MISYVVADYEEQLYAALDRGDSLASICRWTPECFITVLEDQDLRSPSGVWLPELDNVLWRARFSDERRRAMREVKREAKRIRSERRAA